jgi:hypothetical protein
LTLILRAEAGTSALAVVTKTNASDMTAARLFA